MTLRSICETLKVELVVEIPDDISPQEQNALLEVWKQAIQVTVADPLGQPLFANPYLKTLIFSPVPGAPSTKCINEAYAEGSPCGDKGESVRADKQRQAGSEFYLTTL